MSYLLKNSSISEYLIIYFIYILDTKLNLGLTKLWNKCEKERKLLRSNQLSKSFVGPEKKYLSELTIELFSF